jgi:hypothetical protein
VIPPWKWSRAELVLAAGGTLFTIAFANRVFGRSIDAGDYYFPYRDADYLDVRKGERYGGAAYVPPGTRNGARLLVYLHGNNDGGMLHGGLGASDTDYDLRAMVPEGTVVAAPSQTVAASGTGLWKGFNLDEFVASVEAAIGANVDRSNVILVGHSGAGCTPVGGLLAPLGEILPRLVAVVDVCGSAGYGDLFGKLGEKVPVRVFYQVGTWSRDFAGFHQGLRGRASFERIDTPAGKNPHSAIVPIAVQKVLAETV